LQKLITIYFEISYCVVVGIAVVMFISMRELTVMLNCDIHWLVGWLIGWLAGWLVGWLVGWLALCDFL